MAHKVLQFPATIYPSEAEAECPEAVEMIAVLIREMAAEGPSPDGYASKNLGKSMGYLWQINLKVEKRQVRILYAPYKDKIVIFRIHKKSSPQEQQRAYDLAMKRKNEYEDALKKVERAHDGNRTAH